MVLSHAQSALGLCLTTASALVVWVCFQRTRAAVLLSWARIFGLLAVPFALNILFPASLPARAVSGVLLFVAALGIFDLAWSPPPVPHFHAWQAVFVVLMIGWGAIRLWMPPGDLAWLPTAAASGLVLCGAAFRFSKTAPGSRLPAALLRAFASTLLAIWIVLDSAGWPGAYGTAASVIFSCGLLLAAVGAISGVYEQHQFKMEEQALALSTLAFSGGPSTQNLTEILENVLDRILHILDATSGVVWITESEQQPGAQVIRGLDSGFEQIWEGEEGRRKAAALIEKMGGLLIVRRSRAGGLPPAG